MSHDDDALGTALWLAAGGAAGYAAGRWLVAPALAKRPSVLSTLAAPVAPVLTRPPALRALASGPSGSAMPIDPYAPSGSTSIVAGGPSGAMQPMDPYADPVSTASASTATIIIQSPTTPATPVNARPSGSTPVDGPITMPSQLPAQLDLRPASSVMVARPVTQTSARFATSPRVRQFDPVFERYRGVLPIEYIRALVERESDGQPTVRAGSAIGLMQIVPVVLADYNKRHGSSYTGEHLADPAINVAIGCELLRIIAVSYLKNHPRIRTLQPDWDNPDYIALLTLGWNAGYSEAGGLGRVARYLEGLGAVDITIDQVAAHAAVAGATKHLSNPAKVAWCKSVVALYQRERALRPSSPMV